MDLESIVAVLLFGATVVLVLLIVVFLGLTIWRRLRTPRFDAPDAPRRVEVEAPRTRPMIEARWDRQVRSPPEDRGDSSPRIGD